ncbi:DUF3097 family protein, partial [Streptomyces hirsutus]|uniref:DUF3097 family protein n=1 Tax=Streptomyces hirsutus TaxID=35620 RepID=UPI0033B08A43
DGFLARSTRSALDEVAGGPGQGRRKTGVCRALGWRVANTGEAWQHILGRVRSYKDLEPELLGRVEELIDFVTVPS